MTCRDGKNLNCISWGYINGGEEGVVIGHTGTQNPLNMDELTKRMQTLMEELNKSKKKGKGEPSSANICDMSSAIKTGKNKQAGIYAKI